MTARVDAKLASVDGPRESRRRSLGRRPLIVPFLASLLGMAGSGWVMVGSCARASVLTQGATATSLAGPQSIKVLPSGTVLYLRLETPVSTRATHLNAAVTARVVRDVPGPNGIAIPMGAAVRGQVDKVIPSSNPADRARVRLRFTQLEIPGLATVVLAGHVTEVENARESILPDGTIQGVLASELPVAQLEDALGKLGKDAEPLQKQAEGALGKSDTSITYSAGTDLAIVLDKPLEVVRAFPPALPSTLSQSAAAVEKFLSGAPQRVEGKDGTPGDPLNLVVIGTAAAIRSVFQKAGWSEAEEKNANSIWETIRAVAGNQGYGRAPVSQLYLYGRHEDLAFEKMLNTFAKRHHLRLWRSSATTPEGREIWLGAATHDTGLDVRPGVFSHAIDPNLDAEREKVGADLAATERVASEEFLARPDPLLEGVTATGAPWKTDGRLLAIELKAGN